MTHTRRDFLQTLLAIGGAAATLNAVGCGDDDTPGDDGGVGGDASGDVDAGAPAEDAGTPAEDAGTPAEDAGPAPACESVTTTIGRNHGHSLTVSADDVMAGVERSYNIQGSSRHPHTVVVTPAHFAALAAGMTVTVTSSRDGSPEHPHDVTLRCT
ncbi:MAG: twin-arginine translocation signal domain-containing protein [Myxococcales bacterium]|nr:twin-arginine translocation signal domain-containing protein [Myxococcales bacterium]